MTREEAEALLAERRRDFADKKAASKKSNGAAPVVNLHAAKTPAQALVPSEFPDVTATGALKPTAANVRVAVGLLGINCGYDEFHDKLIIGGQIIGQYAGELSDHACLVLRTLIDHEFHFDGLRDKTFDACVQLCLENRYDPIREHIDGLRWDGKPRLETWLSTYLGAENSALNRAIGRIILIALVRRVRQPGCKFDHIPVFEGREGVLKSSMLKVLAGCDENFSDQTILGRSDKEQQELLRGKLVFEIAELSNMRRTEVEHVKAFCSRTHDRARPAYGRQVIDLPRRVLICATTNDKEYLKSQTGNRRFWPIEVAKLHAIDIHLLDHDYNQLLAEAAVAETARESIVLPKELWTVAAVEQDERRQADPWEEILRNTKGELSGNQERVTTSELLMTLGIPTERQNTPILKRVGDCMRLLGWEGPKQMKVNGRKTRGYWRLYRPENDGSSDFEG